MLPCRNVAGWGGPERLGAPRERNWSPGAPDRHKEHVRMRFGACSTSAHAGTRPRNRTGRGRHRPVSPRWEAGGDRGGYWKGSKAGIRCHAPPLRSLPAWHSAGKGTGRRPSSKRITHRPAAEHRAGASGRRGTGGEGPCPCRTRPRQPDVGRAVQTRQLAHGDLLLPDGFQGPHRQARRVGDVPAAVRRGAAPRRR